MTMRAAMMVGGIALSAILAGCSRAPSSGNGADSVAVVIPTSAGRPSAAGSSQRPPCPATGEWAVCSIEQRIKRAGLVARKIDGETAARAAFSMKPIVYSLGRDSRLELFIYPSAAALAKAVEKIDTIKVAPRGATESWGTIPPILIRSANLAAVLLSSDAREADRLYLALTAGPPSVGR